MSPRPDRTTQVSATLLDRQSRRAASCRADGHGDRASPASAAVSTKWASAAWWAQRARALICTPGGPFRIKDKTAMKFMWNYYRALLRELRNQSNAPRKPAPR